MRNKTKYPAEPIGPIKIIDEEGRSMKNIETPPAVPFHSSQIQRYLEQWSRFCDLFGWNKDAPYWGLLPWTPQLQALMEEVMAHPQTKPLLPFGGLSRMALSGWVATRDLRYAHTARSAYEQDVLASESANFNLPSLTQAVRLQGWLFGLGWVLDSGAFDATFYDRLLAGLVRLTERLTVRMCPASMNWRVAEAANLLKISLLLDVLPQAPHWQGVAVRALNDALHRQINPDGSHRERNPHYHIWMTQEFTVLWRMARALPELGLRVPTERVAALWDYALYCQRPNGTENGLHDSRGWFSGDRPDAVRKDRDQFHREAGLPAELPSPHRWFPDAGQAILRDTWDRDCVYVTFDATRWGEGHCHYSRNSIQLHAYGRTLLADPGVFEYRNSPLGNYGRSTRAHSTLNLNGWNQTQTNPSRAEFRQADGYDLVLSDYEGTFHPGRLSMVCAEDLGPGLWASHHRCLLWVHGRALVAIDSFVRVPDHSEQPDQAPRLESNWQMGPGPVQWDPDARRLTTGHPDANLLMLFPVLADGWTSALHTGETDPPRGFVSQLHNQHGEEIPNFGQPIPASQLCLSLTPMRGARAEFVSVLVPFRGTVTPKVQAVGRPATLVQPGTLGLTWGDGHTDDFIWSYRLDIGLGQGDRFDTDASLVHIARDAAGAEHGVAVDATYLFPYHTGTTDRPGMIRF
jgi:hypothetical protein